jgi:hypothetical protein
MKTFALTLSVFLNIVLAGLLIYSMLEGCAEIANGRIGELTQDIKVGYFGSNKSVFTLPKGLVVREASATGADRFEPHRFRLIVTTENEHLVNYTTRGRSEIEQHNEFYSADIYLHDQK